ncbi:hypothetical protein [Paracoccus sp. (in: a-proteobacteria)]|uniref:hypothetical protein n=1 Tax=Paracoccus sp. TaxID=267 RepID=UPI0026DF0937|nr:hypothetical protein [Paracoccus sp. (in: a-proteobacteria)]MDO5369579.1 hypothetical protein [Paracoccus sp. (in: a-proteobacteria)]
MRLVRVLALLFLPAPALAATGPADQPAAVCEWAAMTAAAEMGVPPDILGALTLTETGRRRGDLVRPWAWSVNAEGAGSWFDDPAEALAFAQDRIEQGRVNLDIGCFQLNYRWHGENFPSVVEMFDPLENARYAARFVRDLHAETGDWRRAAGAFHSRTAVHANRYLARFDELRATFKAQGFQGMTGAPETYNSFAMAAPVAPEKVARARQRLTLLGAPLGSERTGSPGSLAVVGQGRGPLIGSSRGSLLAMGQGPEEPEAEAPSEPL